MENQLNFEEMNDKLKGVQIQFEDGLKREIEILDILKKEFNEDFKKFTNNSINEKICFIENCIDEAKRLENNNVLFKNETDEEILNNINIDTDLRTIDNHNNFKRINKLYIAFLNDIKENIIQTLTDQKNHVHKLKWNASQNDFLELSKALIESKSIIGTQKDLIFGLSKLFDIEIKNPDQQIQSMKNSRNAENQTKFLDKLKKSLENHLNK